MAYAGSSVSICGSTESRILPPFLSNSLVGVSIHQTPCPALSQHARRRIVRDLRRIVFRKRSRRLLPGAIARQRAPLLEFRAAVGVPAERRPAGVRQKLRFGIKRRDEPPRDAGFGPVEIMHVRPPGSSSAPLLSYF